MSKESDTEVGFPGVKSVADMLSGSMGADKILSFSVDGLVKSTSPSSGANRLEVSTNFSSTLPGRCCSYMVLVEELHMSEYWHLRWSDSFEQELLLTKSTETGCSALFTKFGYKDFVACALKEPL
ncbi:hypothetical protein PS2_025670 [Malus domestica]